MIEYGAIVASATQSQTTDGAGSNLCYAGTAYQMSIVHAPGTRQAIPLPTLYRDGWE
jgi:hypothetical protein